MQVICQVKVRFVNQFWSIKGMKMNNQDHVLELKEEQELNSLFGTDSNMKRKKPEAPSIQGNNAPLKSRKDPMKLINKIYFDDHWTKFKKALDFYYPARDYKKYYIALRSLSSYLKKPKTTVVLGEYGEHLIKTILKIHPEENILVYKGTNKKDLVLERWDHVKLAHFVYFKENRELIHGRYMRDVKSFDIRNRFGIDTVPNVTILTSVQKQHLPQKFKDSPVIIELDSFGKALNSLAYFESFKQGKKYEYNLLKTSIEEDLNLLRSHLESLRLDFKIEIPYDNVLRSIFDLKQSVILFKEFLDLIKYLTFFNQKYRDWYEDKTTKRKYLLAHVNDFIIASQIATHVFTRPSHNLKPAKLAFFNFLVKKADAKRKRSELSNISVYDVQIEQSQIIEEYPGKKSTLILWLKEFSGKLGLLSKNQYTKNAKVYFSLNKIAPLHFNNSLKLYSRIKRKYYARLEVIKVIQEKKNSQIKFHSIQKRGKK